MYAPHRTQASVYSRIHVETGVTDADPHRLIEMLFDGLMESISQARGAMRSGDIAAKGRAISRAARIVDEGLAGVLELGAGGKLAVDLRDLYDYVVRRLTHANLKNDEAALLECAALMQPVRDAWVAIRPTVAAGR